MYLQDAYPTLKTYRSQSGFINLYPQPYPVVYQQSTQALHPSIVSTDARMFQLQKKMNSRDR